MPRPKKQVTTEETNPTIERIKKTHYTAKEAYQYLGFSRDTFNNYVRHNPDEFGYTVFFGDRGYYRKDKINAMKERFEALIMVAETSRFEFRAARMEDLEAEDHMAYLNFGSGSKSPERNASRRRYLEVNPYTSFHLYNSDNLVALLNLVPLKHEAILEFRQGKRGWMFPNEMIEQYESGRELELIIIDLATLTNTTLANRKMYAGSLLHELAIQLAKWGSQGIDIKSIDACGGTPEGRRILEHAGFVHTGTYQIPSLDNPNVLSNRPMYRLDIDKSDLAMLHRYKQALADWKAKQA
jgi:hypothetical protein